MAHPCVYNVLVINQTGRVVAAVLEGVASVLCLLIWNTSGTSLQVEELVRLSLNHPVRLFVDSNTDVADNLRQEFVRIKTKKEGDREAIVTGV